MTFILSRDSYERTYIPRNQREAGIDWREWEGRLGPLVSYTTELLRLFGIGAICAAVFLGLMVAW